MRSSEEDMGDIGGLHGWSSSSSTRGLDTLTSESALKSSSSSPRVSRSESSHSASEAFASGPPQLLSLLASGTITNFASPQNTPLRLHCLLHRVEVHDLHHS